MNGSRLVIFPICYSWNWNGSKKVPKKRKSEASAGKRTLKFQLPCEPQTSLCLSSLLATSLVGFSENTLHDYKINFQGVILAEIMLQLSSFLYSFHSLNQSSRGKNIERKSWTVFLHRERKNSVEDVFWGQLYNSQLHSSILAKSDDRVFCIFETLQKLRINFIRFK